MSILKLSILKKPVRRSLADPKLRAKLSNGMGHNYYGEVFLN